MFQSPSIPLVKASRSELPPKLPRCPLHHFTATWAHLAAADAVVEGSAVVVVGIVAAGSQFLFLSLAVVHSESLTQFLAALEADDLNVTKATQKPGSLLSCRVPSRARAIISIFSATWKLRDRDGQGAGRGSNFPRTKRHCNHRLGCEDAPQVLAEVGDRLMVDA